MKKKNIIIMIILLFSLTSCRSVRDREDKEAPTITIEAFAEEFFIEDGVPRIAATCTDDEDETCLVTTPNYPDLSVHGEHTITFKAEDSSGNIALKTVKVKAIKRALYILFDIDPQQTNIELGSTYIFPNVSCTSTIADTCTVTVPNAVDTSKIGEVSYTIYGSDDLNNTNTIEITITVVDTTAPEISLIGDATINLAINADWTDPGVITSDLQTVVVTQDSTVDLTTVGTYVITYTATDASGNTNTITRTVIVS